MVRLAAVLVVFSTVLATSNALAGGPPGMTPVTTPVEAPKQELVESYALQTLASDTATVALFVLASRRHTDSQDAAAYGKLGLMTFLLGPPIIHLFHARGGAFLGSLGMRVGTIVLTAAALSGSDDGGGSVLAPLLVGGLVASIVDAAVLARADEPPPPPATKRARAGRWQPTIATTQHTFSLGVAGSF